MQIEIFSKVKDPRDLGKVKHELEDVLRMALIGVLCELLRTVTTYRIWLQTERKNSRQPDLLKLCNGVPCGDTILRVVESVNPAQLEQSRLLPRPQ